MAKVLPTLNINQPIVEDLSQIMVSLLKFAFWNPGWTSSYLEHTLVSMRKLRAETGQDIENFPHRLQVYLGEAVRRYDPSLQVTVTPTRIGVTTYSLSIAITNGQNIPVINLEDIIVRDGEIMLRSDLEPIENV